MGILFGEPDYVPNAKEKWQQRQREAAEERRRWEREQAAAKRIRDEEQREVDKEADRAQKEMEALIKEQKREMRAAEKDMLTKPYHRTEGGSKALGDTPLIVWHWQIPLPPEHNTSVNGQKRSDAGPLLALWDGGGIGDDDVIPLQLVESVGQTPALKDWAKRAGEVLEEVEKRYPIVADLRDDAALERLLRPVGVLRTFNETLPERGVIPAEDGSPITYERPVTVTELPTVSGVEVQPDGLRITFAYRAGETAKRWSSHLDALRVAFNANGVHNASNLRIKDGVNGELILDFDDAPSSFPQAVCIEPPTTVARSTTDAIRRYEGAAWTLGVDARGRCLKFPVDEFPHVLVVGGTGAGKSVWARSVIEMFRTGYRDPDTGRDTAGGFTCFVSSGKVTDFVTLSKLPGVAMVAGDAAQTAVMVRTVKDEAVRRYDEAAAAKLRGEMRAFDYPPIVLFLDEWGATWLAIDAMYKSAKGFETDIDWILRVGREARVHVVLLSQTIRKTGAGAVPGSWQANLGLTISLGKPEAETYNNPAVFPAGARERAERVGNQIAGKRGRGMAVLEGNVTEFQSYYVWSPGTTSLHPDADKKVAPPTPEVRALWERWEPLSASVPWLAPRLGFRVDDPEWAGSGDGKADLEQVSSTPVVALTDRSGNLKEGMVRFDPWSPEWVGKQSTTASRRAALDFTDEDGDGVDDRAQPTSPDRPTVKAERDANPATVSKGQDSLRVPTPEEIAAMTAEEPESAEPEPEGQDAATEPSAPAPKRSTTTPTTQGDDF
ncbi:cell division protein FtsK [Mycobacteroides abscessus]|uniref:cell division protein FtsK n=1 Tax=Mycobacteroides abscessus TaxID=36809 RepID=UPI000C25BDFB|nr:cell division protein FtsK [Mycobacteroides abscessus]